MVMNPLATAAMNPEDRTTAQILWILRVGVAMEFIGHGALGILHLAPSWVNYFAVVGIGKDSALQLMPMVGVADVTMGLAVLFYPVEGRNPVDGGLGALDCHSPAPGRRVRLGGRGAGRELRRSLALFLLAQGGVAGTWLNFRVSDALKGGRFGRFRWLLRSTTVLLLLGHGALQLWVRKPMFGIQYAMLGLHGPWVVPFIGGFECLLAVGVLVWPGFWLLLFVFAWKLATEALSPMAGSPIWVFV